MQKQLPSNITAGAMAPPLHEQLGVPEERVALYQRACDSLHFLRVHRFLGPAVAWRGVGNVIKALRKDLERELDNA